MEGSSSSSGSSAGSPGPRFSVSGRLSVVVPSPSSLPSIVDPSSPTTGPVFGGHSSSGSVGSFSKPQTVADVVPGFGVLDSQLKSGLKLLKYWSKFFLQNSAPALSRYDIMRGKYYRATKGTTADFMGDYVNVCFYASEKYAHIMEETSLFQDHLKVKYGEEMYEQFKSLEAKRSSIGDRAKESAKEVIELRGQIRKQRRECEAQWNKMKTIAEKTPRSRGSSSSISTTKKLRRLDSRKRVEDELEKQLEKTRETFKTLEGLVAESDKAEAAFRDTQVPQFMKELEDIEAERLEYIESSLRRFTEDMNKFAEKIVALSRDVSNSLNILTKQSKTDRWLEQAEHILEGVLKDADFSGTKTFIGLPCRSEELNVEKLPTGEVVLPRALDDVLGKSFMDLVHTRESVIVSEECAMIADIDASVKVRLVQAVSKQEEDPGRRVIEVKAGDVLRITTWDPEVSYDEKDFDDDSEWVQGYVIGFPEGKEGLIKRSLIDNIVLDDKLTFEQLLELPFGVRLFRKFLRTAVIGDAKLGLFNFWLTLKSVSKHLIQTGDLPVEFSKMKREVSPSWVEDLEKNGQGHLISLFSAWSKSGVDEELLPSARIVEIGLELLDLFQEEYKIFKLSTLFDELFKNVLEKSLLTSHPLGLSLP